MTVTSRVLLAFALVGTLSGLVTLAACGPTPGLAQSNTRSLDQPQKRRKTPRARRATELTPANAKATIEELLSRGGTVERSILEGGDDEDVQPYFVEDRLVGDTVPPIGGRVRDVRIEPEFGSGELDAKQINKGVLLARISGTDSLWGVAGGGATVRRYLWLEKPEASSTDYKAFLVRVEDGRFQTMKRVRLRRLTSGQHPMPPLHKEYKMPLARFGVFDRDAPTAPRRSSFGGRQAVHALHPSALRRAPILMDYFAWIRCGPECCVACDFSAFECPGGF